MWLLTPVIPALERWRQENEELKARLGYRRLCIKHTTRERERERWADRKSFRNAPIKEHSEIPALSFGFSLSSLSTLFYLDVTDM